MFSLTDGCCFEDCSAQDTNLVFFIYEGSKVIGKIEEILQDTIRMKDHSILYEKTKIKDLRHYYTGEDIII